MDFEHYTERARGFVQSAQAMALREGHQRFVPEHLLKVLLDDPEGLAGNLIRSAGGKPKEALGLAEAALEKMPKVEGSGAGQLYLAPETARLFEQAEKIAKKAGDSFVTAERLLLALAMAAGTECCGCAEAGRRNAAESKQRDRGATQRPHRRHRVRRAGLRCAQEIYPRPHRRGQGRQARSGDRPG